jgi:hypothetical protein
MARFVEHRGTCMNAVVGVHDCRCSHLCCTQGPDPLHSAPLPWLAFWYKFCLLLLCSALQGPTTFWKTEYDMEFSEKLGLDVEKYVPALREAPGHPRSFKKGYVHHQDYEALVRGFGSC